MPCSPCSKGPLLPSAAEAWRHEAAERAAEKGSPCFDQSWELVALHHGGDPDHAIGHAAAFNEGIPFVKIVAHLGRPGVGIALPRLPE